MIRIQLLVVGLWLSAALAGTAQNRAPVQATQRKPTERVSPMPGVTLPTGASQRNAQPLPAPIRVQPNGTLPLPAMPSGNVTVGPLDSGRVEAPARRPAPRPSPRQRP